MQSELTACDISVMAGGAREVQEDMGETDGVEAQDSRPSRKEHLEIRCEICYACSYPAIWKGGGTDVEDVPAPACNQKSDYDIMMLYVYTHGQSLKHCKTCYVSLCLV